MATMHQGFAPIDFSGFGDLVCDDDASETLPAPGSADLKVEDRCQALFITAEWTLVATVGPHEIGRSTTTKKAHEQAYMARWTRQLIRVNQARLRRLGVDVEKTYVAWGGTLDDLLP